MTRATRTGAGAGASSGSGGGRQGLGEADPWASDKSGGYSDEPPF